MPVNVPEYIGTNMKSQSVRQNVRQSKYVQERSSMDVDKRRTTSMRGQLGK